jgi:hypothetical protein
LELAGSQYSGLFFFLLMYFPEMYVNETSGGRDCPGIQGLRCVGAGQPQVYTGAGCLSTHFNDALAAVIDCY